MAIPEIYRTFVVYGHNYWVIAFPVLLWCGVGVGGFAIPVIEADFDGAHATLTVDRLNVWTNAAVSLTLALNVIGTCAFSVLCGRARVLTGGVQRSLHSASGASPGTRVERLRAAGRRRSNTRCAW